MVNDSSSESGGEPVSKASTDAITAAPSPAARAAPALAPQPRLPEPRMPEPRMPEPPLAAADVERIIHSRHDEPWSVLGPHPSADGSGTVVRAFLPGAESVVLRLLPPAMPMQRAMRRLHRDGLFEGVLETPCPPPAYDLLVGWGEYPPVPVPDPYRFRNRSFQPEDEVAFAAGTHGRLFETLGARPAEQDGTAGVAFAVWAPNAARVSVVGSFNAWDGRRHPMQRLGAHGIWEVFVPGVARGDLYKFELKTPDGSVFLKSDPFAAHCEPPPHRASIVDDTAGFAWSGDWSSGGRRRLVDTRGVRALPPLGWPASGTVPNEPGSASVQPGATYVELPASVAGRAAGGLFTVGTPFASPRAFAAWIDACHRQGIGVAVHAGDLLLPAGAGDLAWFDGTRLYERLPAATTPAQAVPGAAAPPVPAAATFDTSRGEVRSVLLSALVFWVERYQLDALITDADGARALAAPAAELARRNPGFRLIVRDAASATRLTSRDVSRIIAGRHDDPFAVLGAHALTAAAVPAPAPLPTGAPPTGSGGIVPSPTAAVVAPRLGAWVVRALLPAAAAVHVLPARTPEIVIEMRPIDPAGLFEATVPREPGEYRLRVFAEDGSSQVMRDPYAFRDFVFGAQDQHLFAAGNHYRIYEKLGAHPRCVNGVDGVGFAVWAPDAEGVGVAGPFNGWNGLLHQMTRHGISGVWETFIPDLAVGAVYKFEIHARSGQVFLKTDPYAFHTEVPPATASVVHRLENVHRWRDDAWMQQRRNARPWQQPISIYEVHLGSWMLGPGGRRLTYGEVAAKLVPYVKTLGFTHIELLPIAEHPYEPSWGYQVSHFYAPTSRFGAPEDLMEFVDLCHEAGIGVILDWVPGHFPKDAHALARFDGTHLYEHADPRKGEHPDWGTLIFNYGRHEVENFLIANALFWLETYHFDGFRVDAVASMLYLDYSRQGGWIPNVYGGKENLEAIEFLKHTNSVLHARFPGILMIAEESTSWPNVSRPTDAGGLGFGFKWNMGWMHDVLAYISVPPADRRHHHGRLTFSIVYAFNENFILSLSHDEVVHLKRSLLNKMPGAVAEKFANLRLLYALMWAHPGKKLLFMGGELGQESEWSHAQGLEWRALEKKPNRALGWYIRDLNTLYRERPELFEVDFKAGGFEWLEVDNAEESIIAFLRKARDPRRTLLFAANFSAVPRPEHRIGVPYPGAYTLLFDSDAAKYGGTGTPAAGEAVCAEEVPCHGRDFSIRLSLPALTAVIFEPALPI